MSGDQYSISRKNIFQMNVKYNILRKPTGEKIYLQQAYTTRNGERNFFTRKENNTNGKLDLFLKRWKLLVMVNMRGKYFPNFNFVFCNWYENKNNKIVSLYF